MTKLEKIYTLFLSETVKKKGEKIVVLVAIAFFLLHLVCIALTNFNVFEITSFSGLFQNPIAAIYTPFSFILIYEVYLLVYYLPKSTSIYIGKQYEIISLIVIRRIFKDLSNLKFTKNWFSEKYDLLFMCDILAIVILFYLIYIFYRLNNQSLRYQKETAPVSQEVQSFIQIKKKIALFLVPVFLILSLYSLVHWIRESFFSISKLVHDIKDINTLFFDDFFTILILVDVFLLLFSLLHSDQFSKVIRNSGFIISTIMIKLSFAADGILNTILIVASVLFGIIILAIHNKYERLLENK